MMLMMATVTIKEPMMKMLMELFISIGCDDSSLNQDIDSVSCHLKYSSKNTGFLEHFTHLLMIIMMTTTTMMVLVMKMTMMMIIIITRH